MANPRIFLINFRDLIGFSNGGKNREFYFPEETAKALAEMLADPDNQVVIISDKDDEKLMKSFIEAIFLQKSIGMLIPAVPKNIQFVGKSAGISDGLILKVGEEVKSANAVAEVFVIDRHPETVPAARAKNLTPILVPILFGEKRPLSANYLFVAARIGSYADAVKQPLSAELNSVGDRKAEDKLRLLDQLYQRIAELKNKTDKALEDFKAAFNSYKQPKTTLTFEGCMQKLTELDELARLLNNKQMLEAVDNMRREFNIYEARKSEELALKSERVYAESRQATDYETAKRHLQKAKQLYATFGTPQMQLEVFALELSLLRCHQNVLVHSGTGGSCIVMQLEVLNKFNELFAEHQATPNAISYKHLEAKLQPELNNIKQIILGYFLAKLLPGASTGLPAGFDVNQLHLALKIIMDFERHVLVSYKNTFAPEASVLVYLSLDNEIRKIMSATANDVGVNTSYFVVLVEQLITVISTLSPPSAKLLFSKAENLNRLFTLLDAAYAECLKYQSGSLSVPAALNYKNLTKIMHDIIQCKVNVLKESRDITQLYVIGKENVLTKADGKTVSFPEASVPMLRALLSNPNAVVLFTSDSLEFADCLNFIRSNVNQTLAANAIYLPKSYLASVVAPDCDYMRSNIARETVDITEGAEINLIVMPNQPSIDAVFINDVVKSGDYVLTKDQGNWVLAKKQGNDLAPVKIEGNVASVLESLKAIHPAMLTDVQKGQIKAALTANAAQGKVRKPLHNFPVLLVSECIRQQLNIRRPECVTLINNDFRTVYAAYQRGVGAIWTPVVPNVAPEQSSANALALVPVLAVLRSDSNTAKAYTEVTESYSTIDETTRYQPKTGAEVTTQQKSLTALDEKYSRCLHGKALAADKLKEGISVLAKIKALQPLANQRAYDEAYSNLYNGAKKPLLEAIHKAKLFNDKPTLFAALICHADLSAIWHGHAARVDDHSYRVKLNDFISELLVTINQAELGQLIKEFDNKDLLDTFAKLLRVCGSMLEPVKNSAKQDFFRDTKEVTAKAQIEREINLINLTLPKVEARLQELTPSLLSRFLSPTK